MSDLFKGQRPELSDDEDRRLWQRVRAIPGEALGAAPARMPWWRALWAMPAVRYGAPALAALVVAVVWVTERSPEPPARVAADKVGAQAARRDVTREVLPAPTPLESAPADVPTIGSERVDRVRASAPAPEKEVEAKSTASLDAANEARQDLKDESAGAPSAEPPPGREEAGRAEGVRESVGRAARPVAPPAEALAKAKPEAQGVAPAPASESVRGGRADEPRLRLDSLMAAAPPGSPSEPKSGAFKSQVRSSPAPTSPTRSAADRLALGTLPTEAELEQHGILNEIARTVGGSPRNVLVRIPRATAWAPEGGPDYIVDL
ncbi:MAG: hypothetical protein ABI960_10585, partial [Candidatus Eisenbacteria bacterium]